MASLSSVKNRLPRLQKLTIGISSPTSIDQFSCAPQLRHLNLGSIIPSSMIKIPWNQLQCFTLGMCRAESCVEYLRLTPNLLECTLSLVGAPLHILDSQTPVQLPQLRSIILRGDPSCILDKLQVPELHEVSIFPYRWAATPQLTALFLRCSLRVFSFDLNVSDDCPSDNDMIQLLQASPTLVELHLRSRSSQCMTSSFLTQFASHQGSGDSRALHLVPLLHTMTVDWSPSRFNILEFAEGIQSRMAFGVLRRVEICHNPAEGATEFLRSRAPSRLRQLRDIGLDIRVRHRDSDLI
jgi:hypothetical protein